MSQMHGGICSFLHVELYASQLFIPFLVNIYLTHVFMKYSEAFTARIKTTVRLIILYQSQAGDNASYRSCNQVRPRISALFKQYLYILRMT